MWTVYLHLETHSYNFCFELFITQTQAKFYAIIRFELHLPIANKLQEFPFLTGAIWTV
jgi:hypothetical protein